MNKVSIIVPVYNAEEYLEKCAKSILNQTYKNIEIIFVDDGSLDSSLEILDKLKNEFSNVIVIKQNHLGVSRARNNGLENASGKYVFFVDADDSLDKNVIESLVKNTKDGELVGIKAVVEGGKRKYILERKPEYEAKNIVSEVLKNEMQGFSWGYLFEREKCPRFNENTGYLEDFLFLIDYIEQNKIKKVSFLPESAGLYHYTKNPKSATNNKKDVLKKLEYINTALETLRAAQDEEVLKLIDNKKNELFAFELAKTDEKTLREAVCKIPLEEYNGTSKIISAFSKLYREKKVKKLSIFLKIKSLSDKLYHFIY